MALADFAPAANRTPSIVSASFRSLVAWFAARRAARAKSLALHDLLSMPQGRLDDLGISRYEIMDAMNDRRG